MLSMCTVTGRHGAVGCEQPTEASPAVSKSSLLKASPRVPSSVLPEALAGLSSVIGSVTLAREALTNPWDGEDSRLANESRMAPA